MLFAEIRLAQHSYLDFFKNIIIVDENWCFAYDPRPECHSISWVGETLRSLTKLRFQKSFVKTMLMIFFDWQNATHKELVADDLTVNAIYYKDIMVRLLSRIR